jgi:lipopolysaccharide/colanic/teichoic acid biosynthesis glycosyltransferase
MATEEATATGSKVRLTGIEISEGSFPEARALELEQPPHPNWGERVSPWPDARRVLNIIVAVIGIIVALPIGLVIALLIWLTSPGPVFYSQLRVGVDRRQWGDSLEIDPRRRVDWGGKPFLIYKFRTMRWDPTQNTQVWAKNGDPRITRLGRFLRMSRLDELPQLYNVLRGDMNVVGPRPEQPKIFVELREKIDGYADRQRVLPGLTGLAQINQSYDSNLSDVRAKIAYDLEYIRSQSCMTDLEILLRTFPVVLFLKGGVPRA